MTNISIRNTSATITVDRAVIPALISMLRTASAIALADRSLLSREKYNEIRNYLLSIYKAEIFQLFEEKKWAEYLISLEDGGPWSIHAEYKQKSVVYIIIETGEIKLKSHPVIEPDNSIENIKRLINLVVDEVQASTPITAERIPHVISDGYFLFDISESA